MGIYNIIMIHNCFFFLSTTAKILFTQSSIAFNNRSKSFLIIQFLFSCRVSGCRPKQEMNQTGGDLKLSDIVPSLTTNSHFQVSAVILYLQNHSILQDIGYFVLLPCNKAHISNLRHALIFRPFPWCEV